MTVVMKTSFLSWPVVCAVLLGACGDSVRAPLTIIVDTDLARAREERGRLEALRAGVQGDRADLDAARGELERARRRLEETTAKGPQRDALIAEVRALEETLCRAPSVGIPDVEKAVAAGVEAGVARALQAHSSSTPPAATPTTPLALVPPSAAPPSSPPLSDHSGLAREKLREARALARVRRFDLADLPGAVALVERIGALAARGEGATALELATQLEDQVRTVVIDRALLLRRYERLNTLVRQRAAEASLREAVTALLRQASEALSRGDLDGAAQALLKVASLLETARLGQ